MDFRTCQRKLSCELDVFKSSQEIEAQLDGLNVEDGLSAKDNETFLLASMAFLQQHAKRKLGVINEEEPEFEPENKKYKPTFSNMLLFESHYGEQRDRYYIKLKNCDKFDNIMKSETCIPTASALSKEHILPKVKNPKKFAKLFQSTSKTSIFNLFRPGKSKRKPQMMHRDDNETDTELQETRNDWTWGMKQKCLSSQCQQQEEQLRYLSGLNSEQDNLLIKASVHKRLRARPTDSMTTVEQFLFEDDEEETYDDNVQHEKLPNVYGNETNSLKCFTKQMHYDGRAKSRERRKKLNRPLSKISVCIEDESESEYNYRPPSGKSRSSKSGKSGQAFGKSNSQLSAYSNFSDELKANLSPEVLQTIISEMIVFLEDTPNNKGASSSHN